MNAMSEGIGQLTAALAKAQGAMGAALIDGSAKIATKTGTSYGYTYASLTSVWQAIRKPLADNELAVIQRIDDENGVMFLHTVLSHSSGEYITSRLSVGQIGRPAQETGSAITYARRYALSALVGVVTDEDDDGAEATKGQKDSTTKRQASQVVKPEPPTNGKCICTGLYSWPNVPNPDCPVHVPNGFANTSGFRPEPGEQVWADWRSPNDAQAWAWSQGKFNAPKHMTNAYAKVKADCKPANARDMWRCWYEYVMAHEPVTVSADAMLDKVDMSLLAHDEDEPLFN